MNTECFSIAAVPGLSRLFTDFCADSERVRSWYGASIRERKFKTDRQPLLPDHRESLAALLASQNATATLEPSIERVRHGADVVVTGQQVGILGGPLFTPFKAASAISLAQEASAQGRPHVPLFWIASEDHDFAEINHVTFPVRQGLSRLTYASAPGEAVPVGALVLDDSITQVIDQAWEVLGYSQAMEWLTAAYQPGRTLAQAFAEFYGKVFAAQGLLVLDAAGRDAHRLGAPVLRAAIERADELHAALNERNAELQTAGYHAQVVVGDRGSLLFLIDSATGARVALKRTAASSNEPGGLWQAGRQRYSTAELIGILEAEPERLSPSALLRPVFQDQILPTAAYIGGPAEVAYFAQSSVLYGCILGRTTPVFPRLSATLIEPAIAQLLDRHELSLETIFDNSESALAQRLAARAMPIAGKQKLAAAGNALDLELAALTEYLTSLDEGLGRSAQVSASKMRYQMSRLRRVAANFELSKEASLGRHAKVLNNALYPDGGLQERTIGAAYFLGRYGSDLVELLVREAGDPCPGHKAIRL